MGYFVLEIESIENGKKFNFEIISINAEKSDVSEVCMGPKMDFLFSVFIDVFWGVEHEF